MAYIQEPSNKQTVVGILLKWLRLPRAEDAVAGYEAIARYGVLKGGGLAVWRVLRCNPLSKGGFDPVH